MGKPLFLGWLFSIKSRILEINHNAMIKIIKRVPDNKTNEIYQPGAVIDLGKTRNEAAIKNGYAIWVEETTTEAATEKKEGTPKKTTSSARGKKINTK